MEYVNLGKTGLKISKLCLGCMSFGTPQWRPWVLPEENSRAIIKHALDLGINFLDTADVYSLGVSEQVTGRAVKDFCKRDEVVIATKVGIPTGDGLYDRGLSRKRVLYSIDASLRRLQMDYVDLYQIHRWDYETPIEETLDALYDIVRSGKARYIGASSMFAWQFAKAQFTADLHGWPRFVTMQNHYNLIYREEEREMNPFCRDQGVGLLPWSPLARGYLAGSRSRTGSTDSTRGKVDSFGREQYASEENFDIIDRVVDLATRRGIKPMQLALGWLLNNQIVSAPIIGATKPDQLDDAVAALDVRLDAEELRFLEELYQPRPILGHT